MINRILGILVIGAATTASAGDDLSRHILERAASCWPTQTAMRGISFSADVHVSFTREGQVSAIEIVDVAPQTETFQALAKDFADALKQCGPYGTEGVSEMDLNLSWPL
ncbi:MULTISPECIES: hypothetical protein [unclassified Mesorhizobium]|uniref:hypothetical protein n=1 Tax=unclassified Mesorhizobium TaxID=325217 RepID=UPI000F7640EA|nr:MULTISPECIES: hypothetical protein [unclassified Mesorhizobium]RUU45510.1 hypothetical protein EOD08_09475 [Mesorhizobium sp. M6A.T.Ca.TU.002.02.2.1]AZO65252.1 hypothetical protein EJ075_09875 [Mesorhizobium sp. M6A.T.Cr.TU.016.01.1.1]RVB74450.1 hypothetical protein EN885_22765 [Mesorhizobium sp. M6A.T.Cr.TU.014.01.1.1]RWN66801.1 MAG: hypothetical protein EOR99_14630 [Mesorhizobium sp.]RWP50103.1 MAG: hypothetical protein EOR06_24395 [Mesorhizobium sp.]